MMTSKYISPGGWFSLEYPVAWSEFEDSEGTFLFYNPNEWCGNFRISAYRDIAKDYAKQCVDYELNRNKESKRVKVGEWECAYCSETFIEKGTWYTSHIWITGQGNTSIECSFTVIKGEEYSIAEEMIRSIHIRTNKDFTKQEIIPVRVMEISEINDAFEWTSTTIKKTLTKDFTSQESDIERIQKVMDLGTIKSDQRIAWERLGLAFGTILENEIDGMNWVTVIEGRKEYAALQFKHSSLLIDPANLLWEKIKSHQSCNLSHEFEQIKNKVEQVLNQ